ncbi:MAG: ABC transporter substrate-binding protein [Chloroflexi bacterium]|nr:ABC transporter substrate-binding protein [Chloroflexota bacterium]
MGADAFFRCRWIIGLLWVALGAAGCVAAISPATPTLLPDNVRPGETPSPPSAPPIVEVEVTRVVYRETIVTPTPAPPQPCGAQDLADVEEVVVGVLLPLSVPAFWMRSTSMQAGLNLAVERLSPGGIGGKPLRLAVYDGADDPMRSVQLAEELIVEACAGALIVGLGDSATSAVAGVAERYRVPMVVLEAAAPSLTASQPASLFRIAPDTTMVAAMPSQWLAEVGDYNQDGRLLAVVIAENSAAGDLFVEQSRQGFAEHAIETVVHRVDLPMIDFSPEIARLLAMPAVPDAVFIVLWGDGALTLHTQLFDAGIRPETGTLLVNHSRRALDPGQFGLRSVLPAGSIVVRRGPWPSNATAMGQELFERYRQSGLAWPELTVFLAHDALLLVADAIQRSGAVRGPELAVALESSDLELAAGHYTFPYGSKRPPEDLQLPAAAWHQWLEVPLLYLMYTVDGQEPALLPVVWPPAYRTSAAPVGG